MSGDEATRWALAASTGDPVAAAAFVRTTSTELWRFVGSLVGVAAADDLTQETYLRALRALPSFQGRASARTWLFGIAKRACADHLRATVRERKLADRVVSQATTAGTTEGDPAGAFSAAQLVQSLPEPRRSAFVLTQMVGLSYAEAAEAEGCPIGTIRSRVARARDDLIAALTQTTTASSGTGRPAGATNPT